jgi:hypothetical protein
MHYAKWKKRLKRLHSVRFHLYDILGGREISSWVVDERGSMKEFGGHDKTILCSDCDGHYMNVYIFLNV